MTAATGATPCCRAPRWGGWARREISGRRSRSSERIIGARIAGCAPLRVYVCAYVSLCMLCVYVRKEGNGAHFFSKKRRRSGSRSRAEQSQSSRNWCLRGMNTAEECSDLASSSFSDTEVDA